MKKEIRKVLEFNRITIPQEVLNQVLINKGSFVYVWAEVDRIIISAVNPHKSPELNEDETNR